MRPGPRFDRLNPPEMMPLTVPVPALLPMAAFAVMVTGPETTAPLSSRSAPKSWPAAVSTQPLPAMLKELARVSAEAQKTCAPEPIVTFPEPRALALVFTATRTSEMLVPPE